MPSSAEIAVSLEAVSHSYGPRRALDGVSFRVTSGELFAVVGPNGGGKTTLFRLLSTLMPLREGRVEVLGHDLATQPALVRRGIGVVFQAPSLDRKLTVAENMQQQGALYGLSGAELRNRSARLLEDLQLADRAGDYCEKLSGGLRRRAEIAKCLLHEPRLLLLDEPSTGLDPGIRAELWRMLEKLRAARGMTILVTTHLLEEAEQADHVAILHEGRLVALDTPDALRAAVAGDSITIETEDPEDLAAALREQLGLEATLIGGRLRLEQPEGHNLIPQLVEAFPGCIRSVTLGLPTLEDVFFQRTGRSFGEGPGREGAA